MFHPKRPQYSYTIPIQSSKLPRNKLMIEPFFGTYLDLCSENKRGKCFFSVNKKFVSNFSSDHLPAYYCCTNDPGPISHRGCTGASTVQESSKQRNESVSANAHLTSVQKQAALANIRQQQLVQCRDTCHHCRKINNVIIMRFSAKFLLRILIKW